MSGFPQQFFQAAWIVNDLEEAINRWVKTAQVGPFFVIPHSEVQDVRYRGGQSIDLDFSVALAQAGPIQIELIQQHNEGPSAYRDTYAAGQEGFHHMCGFVDDYDAEVERQARLGFPVAHAGWVGDMRFAYLDTRASLGFMTEIIEDRQYVRDLFKMVADAAVGWDGDEPVRFL